MKNLISTLLGLLKKKKPVVETPVTILQEIKEAPKPIEVKPAVSDVKAVLTPAAPDQATPKKKRYYKPKPKKSNG
jgi:hypothetical protein